MPWRAKKLFEQAPLVLLIGSAQGKEPDFLRTVYAQVISKHVYYFPTERIALNYMASDMLNAQSDGDNSSQPRILPREMITLPYPTAVKDYILFVYKPHYRNGVDSDLPKPQTGPILQILEEKLLNGKVQLSEEGRILYQPEEAEKDQEIAQSPAAVKSLAGLAIFLKEICPYPTHHRVRRAGAALASGPANHPGPLGGTDGATGPAHCSLHPERLHRQ
ncbi:MAG: hypothetical protein HC880_11825 [Bacteroidia bacterium]|nr:hypothetical protein [Bacteroidia bacterium]